MYSPYVLLVPNLSYNLICVSKVTEAGKSIIALKKLNAIFLVLMGK